jgi:hypothetical protein
MRAAAFAGRAACTIAAMAYDEELAERIRQLIGDDPELTEKKMFGGLAFLIRGNMAVAAAARVAPWSASIPRSRTPWRRRRRPRR